MKILSWLLFGFFLIVMSLPSIIVGCVIEEDFNRKLDGVGIERIAECKNAYSNWYEIVWKEKK